MAKTKFYSSPFWQKLRTAALRRDNYTCQVCSARLYKKGSRPTVDHIKPRPFSDNKTDLDNLANLQTMCQKCHAIKTAGDGSRGEAKPVIDINGYPPDWQD